MTKTTCLLGCLLLAACGVTGEPEESREETAMRDFIEVSELKSVDVIRTMAQLSSSEINDTYVIASTRKEEFLIEYFSRCLRRHDGTVEPDHRTDSRALYAVVDTFRGCRIKAIYVLEPGQADEVRELGETVGGGSR